MMTLEEIKKHICEAFIKGGYNFNDYKIEVSINSRLTSTLGRCKCQGVNNIWKPISIEFSKKFLAVGTEQEILDVIYHEVAHALVCIETKEKHGHDAAFKRMCGRIGTTNDGAYTSIQAYKEEEENTTYKYDIFCKDCLRLVAQRSRACKVTKNPELFKCKCGGALRVVQNY